MIKPKNESFLYISLFVLLWGSAAIFTKWGLHHGNAIPFLFFRFLIATALILFFCVISKQPFYPQNTSFKYVIFTGCFLITGYTLFYFLSLEFGISPGLLSTILALQPILTFFLTEKSFSKVKLTGLLLSFFGIICLVYNNMFVNKLSLWATLASVICLACITTGVILQRKISEKPWHVLPLQYAISLIFILLIIPFQSFSFEMNLDFWIPVLYQGIIVSVIAQLIFYKLLQSGNLVNTTSLFYLVPLVTLILDFIIFNTQLSTFDYIGIAAILSGVYLVYRKATKTNRSQALDHTKDTL
ncbi:DMT family transporter [Acinetobacter sp. C26M]|uniref:DMT family transporter n=1 Tax=unclassified Acinetobacter TaxID=196816 RepID=UPI0020369109|nr:MULTISPECIES: DMT family transporter [unclassified Acinetobacter]USA45531.1 DMT family transporter [Acinetobacter sp. C26M]USA49032.1 DMT family transporter [Acinetobacter sp. C26G]